MNERDEAEASRESLLSNDEEVEVLKPLILTIGLKAKHAEGALVGSLWAHGELILTRRGDAVLRRREFFEGKGVVRA